MTLNAWERESERMMVLAAAAADDDDETTKEFQLRLLVERQIRFPFKPLHTQTDEMVKRALDWRHGCWTVLYPISQYSWDCLWYNWQSIKRIKAYALLDT